MDALSPGSPAPDFLLPQTSGQPPAQLSHLRGQPVVLAFAPSGWDPARAEELAQINRLLRQAGFAGELLGLTRDGAWCRATFPDGQERLPLLLDTEPEGAVARAYGVAGRQALFVLDSDSLIRWRYIAAPGVTPRAEDLRAGLNALAEPEEANAAGGAGLTRREFLAVALGVASALALGAGATRADAAPADAKRPAMLPVASPVGTVPVTLQVNGNAYPLQIEPRVTLLDALRERIGLTGSKKGCDHGQCGACTVHVNGRRVLSCLTLAVACQGKPVTTIEGLAQGDALHPIQAAFIEHDGFQCGYCTPGQIMSAAALLSENVGPDDADVREALSGNLCRCGAYNNIVAAVQQVRKGAGHAPV